MASEYSYFFTEKAEQDLDEILRYISLDLANPIAARNFGKKLFEKIDLIRAFPLVCPIVDNEFISGKDVRKLFIDNYVVYYEALADKQIIYILRIVFGKRNMDEIIKSV